MIIHKKQLLYCWFSLSILCLNQGFFVDLLCIDTKTNHKYLKAILRTPEHAEVEILLLSKEERDSLLSQYSAKNVDVAAYELWPNTQLIEVNGYVLDLIPSFSKKYCPAFYSMDDYLKFIRGEMHYNASYFLDQSNTLHTNYFLEEPSVKKIIGSNKYRLDSLTYPSSESNLHGGYKTYFLDDGSVGYFYNFYPQGNRYTGWWHPSVEDFEWFYHNVYELTDLKSSKQ